MKKNRGGMKYSLTRRDFINRSATVTAGFAFTPVSEVFSGNDLENDSWPPYAREFRIHMIGHGHIDPVWRWPWSEGVSEVHSTFRSALDRMKENPGFYFTASSAQFYQWISENDPSMLEEIRRRVEEGRWNIVGGWWVEPDVNIPCGESMVRQGLYGQLTFESLLGHRAKVAFNPDSFGHAGTLPQIFRLQGMSNYVFMRPGPHEKELPAGLFWWEGPDGSRVLTFRIPISYNVHEPSVKERIKEILEQSAREPVKNIMAFYGVGDHGGGPTKENIHSIEKLKKEEGGPEIFFSSVDSYFSEIRSEDDLSLPVVKDDLQYHAVGCYTAGSEIKKGNRRSEYALITAEKIACLGTAVWGVNYLKEEFTSAWEKVLFLQFHDSIAGASLKEHTQTALEGYGYVLDIANRAKYMSLQKLEWRVAAEDPDSQYLLVFNPHAWEVRGNVEYDLYWGESRLVPFEEEFSRVEDESGNPLMHQWTYASSEARNRKKLVVNTTVPPMGYKQIRLKKGKTPTDKMFVRAEGNTLENELLRMRISAEGMLGIFDKRNSREVFTEGENGCRAVVLDDPSDTWSHGVKSYINEVGRFGNAKLKVLENGPLRATIRVRSSYNKSVLTIDWSLYSGSPNLEAKVSLDWREQLKMLKFSFPVEIESPVATYEIPYGHIVRPTTGDEEPGQRWIDLSGKSNGKTRGLTIINDAKYGYSIMDNDMRISVVRSAVYSHHDPKKLEHDREYYWMDQGTQTFGMLLVPHEGTWRDANVVRVAEEFVSPLAVIYQGIHDGSLPKSESFLSVDVPNVIVSSIKMSEEGEDMIIRCIETSGAETTARVSLRFAGIEWKGSFRPCEIKTLRLNRNAGSISEVTLLEEHV